jgi:hypothetical protein
MSFTHFCHESQLHKIGKCHFKNIVQIPVLNQKIISVYVYFKYHINENIIYHGIG